MKTIREWWLVLTFTGGLLAASAVAEQGPAVIKKPVVPPKLETFSGIIKTLSPSERIVSVKAVFVTKTFAVAPDCQIVTRDKVPAELADLKARDEVDVTYENQKGTLVAQRIAHRGVGPAARDEARWREHLEKILTPNPSERPMD